MAGFAVPQPAAAVAADFGWAPDPAVAGTQTTFTAVHDPSITIYAWDLNGNNSYQDPVDKTGIEVTHTFDSAGTHEVGLATLDDQGNPSETRRTVQVVDPPGPPPNRPPEASFVFFPAGPMAGEPITFVSTSTDPDSPIPRSGLDWDLNGDGRFDDAEGPTATASFPTAGTYTISLRVTTNTRDVASTVLNVGAPGVPGTSVGQAALSLMSPFPVVRIAGSISRRGVRLRRLTVNAPPGAVVKLRCGGRKCPFKRVLRTISSRVEANRALPPTRLLRLRRLERKLFRPGVILRLYVTRPGVIGKYTRFKIRKGKAPARRDLCLVPGSSRPLPCPSR